MDSEDGELFIKQLAGFVRTHEKALANALQFRRQNAPRHGASQSVSSITTGTVPPSPSVPERPSTSASTSSTLAAALSLGTLSFTSHSVKSAKLALTPHHLFYLLSRFEDLGIPVGPMKVRLENLHDTTTSANYVSFLGQSQRSKTHGSDVGSIRSVSSIRSVMSSMSALWSSFGIGSSISAARTEKQKAAIQADLKYLYSAFTKIPCLRLSPDWRARLIKGYEEFPFDSAVPLYVFKNVQALEVSDIDFRQFFGWDRLAEQLRSLTVKRASVDDPADILIDIVLDDMDKRRRRTSKSQASPTRPWPGTSSPPRRSPTVSSSDLYKGTRIPGSPEPRKSTIDLQVGSLNSEIGVDHEVSSAPNSRRASVARIDTDEPGSPSKEDARTRSHSPRRPGSSRNPSSNVRGSYKIRRSGSGSSHSSLSDSWHTSRGSSSNLLAMGILPASKWRFLKHLSLADNSLTSISAASLTPLANTLHSLDLSSNLFTQIPDSLASLTALRALNLAHCMIDSLHSLTRNPLPAITALNLRANRLQSIAGIEKLLPLERLDLRDNRLADPMELARLTGIPEIREIYVQGNPFTRTHRDYRITIFNLFRQTPGYTEDITIDATGPTYAEKRYLVERAEVPPAVPVVKPEPLEMPAVDVSRPAIIYDAPPREPAVLRKDKPASKAASSEVNSSSSRRRRAPKRRIVDLATNDNPMPYARPVDRHSSGASVVAVDSESYYSTSQPSEMRELAPQSILAASPIPNTPEAPREVPRIDTNVIPQLPSIFGSPGTNMDWDIGGELYRQKIEDLRHKVGNGYLSVLSEEGWDAAPHQPEYGTSFGATSPSIHSDSTIPRANLQAIPSGGTLA
ncbi:hypothetical protein C8A05DRAFT_16539 [Staphylotrichum tortipilum]|uniref:Leucine rich repeat domain-containing protein n=1 Tax=Staphylotrichum tortipilum TaxID=2831512 RepID=A0AAN6RSK4_9PEZI|nr:hypothetical protein C8A05DRAFT_16539 [Staphylotrichum longicolle]